MIYNDANCYMRLGRGVSVVTNYMLLWLYGAPGWCTLYFCLGFDYCIDYIYAPNRRYAPNLKQICNLSGFEAASTQSQMLRIEA